MKVRYTGHKDRMPVTLPIGVKKLGLVTQVLFADPLVELDEGDALALVKLDPVNFELAEEIVEKPKAPAKRRRIKSKRRRAR